MSRKMCGNYFAFQFDTEFHKYIVNCTKMTDFGVNVKKFYLFLYSKTASIPLIILLFATYCQLIEIGLKDIVEA